MAGTKAGGLKARDKNLAKDPDFYSKIGKIGGHNGTTGGFYANRELAREAGRKGGRVSRRGKSQNKSADPEPHKPIVEAGVGRFLRLWKKNG